MNKKILIIKTGKSELFEKGSSDYTSLGDVLRTTVILHLYKDEEVFWLTSLEASILLEYNQYINHLLTSAAELQDIFFDLILCLEKDNKLISQLYHQCSYNDWLGFFVVDNHLRVTESFKEILKISQSYQLQAANRKCFSHILYEALGEIWNDQLSILDYCFHQYKSDVGLNWKVGKKLPLKHWPCEAWKKLAFELEQENLQISWQQGFSDLKKYIAWIASCRIIVTSDSLGLHIAQALNIPVIALFGPTSPYEVCKQKHDTFIYNDQLSCLFCYKQSCPYDTMCMHSIDVEEVKRYVHINLAKLSTKGIE